MYNNNWTAGYRYIAPSRTAQKKSLPVLRVLSFTGINVSTELFPSNGCCSVTCLHSCYLGIFMRPECTFLALSWEVHLVKPGAGMFRHLPVYGVARVSRQCWAHKQRRSTITRLMTWLDALLITVQMSLKVLCVNVNIMTWMVSPWLCFEVPYFSRLQ
jgi:hypothetical protein